MNQYRKASASTLELYKKRVHINIDPLYKQKLEAVISKDSKKHALSIIRKWLSTSDNIKKR